MKRLFTILFLLSGLYSVCFAQSTFNVSALEVWEIAQPTIPDIEAHFNITNTTGAVQTIRWERNVVNLVGDSDTKTQVCDLNLCYLPHIGTKTFDIDPGHTGPIIMHFLNPNAYQGASGIINLKMTNVNTPSDSVMVTFLFTSSLSGTNDLPAANVKLFPNPTVDQFQLTNADAVQRIRVFSLDSREVARFTATPGQIYSLASQPAGTYLLALEDANGQAFQAIRLVKQ